MRKRTNGLSREFIIHPGETLREMLEDRGMTQRELAIRTDVKEPHVSNIVNCLKPISVSFAKKLEYALGVDTSFWVNLQANYEKEQADFEEVNQVSPEESKVLKKLKSISDYAKKVNLISSTAQDAMLVIEWRKLLNVSSLARISEVSQVGAYRLAKADNIDPDILFPWLRVCDLITKAQKVNQRLSIEKLRKKLHLIRKLTFEQDVNSVYSGLRKHFADCGIRFSIVKHFAGAPVQGVITKNSDGTLSLIMTLRRKAADIFWFTLFHEIGHIIYDDIDDKLIDYENIRNEREDQIDEFAASVLIDREQYNLFLQEGDFSLSSIKRFCSRQEIPSYILIGRLQRDKHLKYGDYTTEKTKYDIADIVQEHYRNEH